jgi:hypothetical protein
LYPSISGEIGNNWGTGVILPGAKNRSMNSDDFGCFGRTALAPYLKGNSKIYALLLITFRLVIWPDPEF